LTKNWWIIFALQNVIEKLAAVNKIPAMPPMGDSDRNEREIQKWKVF
jgi:hypothetical protein